MTQYDAFEQKLTGALQSDEQPSADFTARVMAQVAQTPQLQAGSSKRTWKVILTAAACLAVAAVAVPVLFFGTMRAGSAAPAAASDCAAPAEEEGFEMEAQEDDATNDFAFMTEAPTTDASASEENGAIKQKSDADSGGYYEEVNISDTALCQRAREILGEIGLESDSGYYVLTAEQGAALHDAIPELKLPEGTFALILEG